MNHSEIQTLLMNKKDKYILDENKNVIPATLLEWAQWLENASMKKIIKQEYVKNYWVSTVFIGLDHSYDENELLIFETMIFNKGSNQEMYVNRYSTWEKAEEGHRIAVQLIKDNLCPTILAS